MAERINAVKTSFFGKGAIRLLGPELQKMGIRRALLVTDRFLYCLLYTSDAADE